MITQVPSEDISGCQVSFHIRTKCGFCDTLVVFEDWERRRGPLKGPTLLSPPIPSYHKPPPISPSLFSHHQHNHHHQQQAMLMSGIESAPFLPVPSAFLIFCCFNLIMALLFLSSTVGGAKPSARRMDEPHGLGGQVSSPAEGVWGTAEVTDDREARGGDGNGGVDAGGSCSSINIAEAGKLEDDQDVCQQSGDEEASDCDELNRRVEEFIVKMNTAWVAEREALRSSMVGMAGELTGYCSSR